MLCRLLEDSGMRTAWEITRFALVAAFIFSGFITTATAGPSSHPFTIWNDRGGALVEYAIHSRTIDLSGRQLRFAGRCLSACTLYLSVSKSCVMRGASFGFHLPYGSSRNGNATAAKYMVRSYPGWVRGWISANGGLERRMKIMPYEYAARYIRPCGV
jgi:hypothetical protein